MFPRTGAFGPVFAKGWKTWCFGMCSGVAVAAARTMPVAYCPGVHAAALPRDLVDAYFAAVDWLQAMLGRAEVVAAWGAPSAVARYTVGGVAAHDVQGVVWLEQLLEDAEPVGGRTVELGEFYGMNRVDGEAVEDPLADSLRETAEGLATTGAPAVAAGCAVARRELVGLLGGASAGRAVPVLRVSGGRVALSDYLRTRVLEVVVHGDDVACSVGGLEVPDPPATSVEVCLGVCLELAEARVGALGALRAFTRAERAVPGALRVL